MTGGRSYTKFVDTMTREEFIRIFASKESPDNWFTDNELKKFSFPKNAGSMGARYLLKKRICDELENRMGPLQIEIMNDKYGKPEVILNTEGLALLKKKDIAEVQCSLSHSRNHLAAMTVFNLANDNNRRL